MKYLLLFFGLFAYGCSQNIDGIQRVYNDRMELIRLFTSMSVMRSRGQNSALLYTHKGDMTNKYFFEIAGDQYQLSNDSIEYVPDLLQLKNPGGSESYKQELTSKVQLLLTQMDELGIRDISVEMAGAGIEFKIYMKSRGVILYVPNLQKVPGPRFSEYIEAMKKLDENWYYTLNE